MRSFLNSYQNFEENIEENFEEIIEASYRPGIDVCGHKTVGILAPHYYRAKMNEKRT